ncbi:MAG: murein L,D-transpeptidase catalytic domain family protein [Gemmatimonadetes bacterium]|nr:murein L,D-transpeptidase catalytic domain family protein [Gemmatimonadota bacterium]
MRIISPSLVAAGAVPVLITIIAATPADRPPPSRADADIPRFAPVGAVVEPGLHDSTNDNAIASADAALRALGLRVRISSHPEALRTAFTAYYNYRDANPDEVKKPYLYYVDMGLDNHTARGYVFDMDSHAIVDGPFTVAHGRGSARTRDGVPTSFSNRPGSYATSLGLYLAQETYSFSGTSGGRRYSSVGLRMRGESGEFNDAARRRGIVAHGAPYVSAGQAGRSEGCPAMEMDRAQHLLPLIANGGVVFIYSPADGRWLRSDPWILVD